LLEKFVTELRFVLLSVARSASSAAVSPAVLTLFSAVARQCFINSYVFALSATEAEHVESLRSDVAARLASGASMPALSLLAIASYMPLHALADPERLLDRRWPDSVGAVLDQQIRAWQEERRLGSVMPALTPVEDDVSLQVRSHYEEHPYPQWLAAEPVGPPTTLDALLSEQFPDSSFIPGGKEGSIDILVAGCGTGRSAIHAAQRFRDAQVLAIDRQTRALGIRNLRHAHADIMKLSSIDRTFEMIESSGVLHHLADPFAAWRILVSLLKPGGVMQIALYSQIARRDVVAARTFIAERGYRPIPEDIRLCRQELLACEDGTPLRNVTLTSDFYSLSDCRDLLFHGQEHRLTLPQIARFLSDNGLRFLGFDIDAAGRGIYSKPRTPIHSFRCISSGFRRRDPPEQGSAGYLVSDPVPVTCRGSCRRYPSHRSSCRALGRGRGRRRPCIPLPCRPDP
jgi:SAM-dependent methyltransferase